MLKLQNQHKKVNSASFWLVLSLLALSPQCIAHADTLKDVMNSKIYSKHNRQSTKVHASTKKWFDENSSFSKLFTEHDGGHYLLEWLSVSATGYTSGVMEVSQKIEYVGARQEVSTEDLKRITILALVPHPKYMDTVEVGLVPQFSELQPPALKIIYSKEIKLNDKVSGMLYEHETGSCSFVVKSAKGAIIALSTKRIDDENLLIALAKKLDFVRLEERLNS